MVLTIYVDDKSYRKHAIEQLASPEELISKLRDDLKHAIEHGCSALLSLAHGVLNGADVDVELGISDEYAAMPDEFTFDGHE